VTRLPVGVSFSGSLLLAGAIVLSRYCRKLTLEIERRWHALSAGVAVAYVFVSIMPELEQHRSAVAESSVGMLLNTDKRIYLWALAGFVVFAGLSWLRSMPVSGFGRAGWLYTGALLGYGLYVLLLGYLLVLREDSSVLSLGLYVFAIGLHLFMVDSELAEQFQHSYESGGRWLLVGCALLGWALGIAGTFPDSVTSRLFAFLAGGVLITAVHAEVRAEEGPRFWWFVGGSAAYATILMLVIADQNCGSELMSRGRSINHQLSAMSSMPEAPKTWPRHAPSSVHVMAKPTGAVCNLDCQYCFFLSKDTLYPGSHFRMAEDLLEAYIRRVLEAQRSPQVTIAWQGGEPTLMGLELFRKANVLARKYLRPGTALEHTIQTNGILLDDEWCEFLAGNGFLVGLSIDGPHAMHDAYRVNKAGDPTFSQVMRAVGLMRRHKVEFNILCTVHDVNVGHPLRSIASFATRSTRSFCNSSLSWSGPRRKRLKLPMPAGEIAITGALSTRKREA
jgi:hypothetical protein